MSAPPRTSLPGVRPAKRPNGHSIGADASPVDTVRLQSRSTNQDAVLPRSQFDLVTTRSLQWPATKAVIHLQYVGCPVQSKGLNGRSGRCQVAPDPKGLLGAHPLDGRQREWMGGNEGGPLTTRAKNVTLLRWGGRAAAAFGSLGRPRTRSPTMLRWISAVPPQMVSDLDKKPRWSPTSTRRTRPADR